MKRTYLGAIFGEAGSYGIVFRDFPGCGSVGDTVDHVIEMGLEALQGHVEVMVEDGDPMPEPSIHTIEDVAAWLDDPEEPTDEPWVGLFPIEIDIPPYPENVNVPLSSDLVRRIAELVDRNLAGLDLSTSRQFIERAAQRELDRIKKSA